VLLILNCVVDPGLHVSTIPHDFGMPDPDLYQGEDLNPHRSRTVDPDPH
jgi:hypothetical protein